MKLYLSCDIEGTSGITHWDETDDKRGGRWYDYFREAMSHEVAAAVRGAREGDDRITDVLVKDAHDSARNIIPTLLPAGIRIHRGWSREPLCMAAGLDETFDAAAFIGYHGPAYANGNPLAHTMVTQTDEVILNGKRCSEFTLNAYAAAMLDVPVVFVSGDAQICQIAKDLIPAITVVPVSEGIGSATISMHPADAQEAIREGMRKAVRARALPASATDCILKLPEHFKMTVRYKEHTAAQQNSFYPGARRLDEKTIEFETDAYYEILRFVMFVL